MLKPLAEITVVDARHAHFSGASGFEPITLEEHYQGVAGIRLGADVPGDIVDTFDRARNAFVYAWYVYELGSVAELQAFSTEELALRLRLGTDSRGASPGLSKLIKRAVRDGVLKDASADERQGLAELVSALRNNRAHGSANLSDPNMTHHVLQLCADMINELYHPL